MQKNSKIYIAGHRGLVCSAIVKSLEVQGYTNLIYFGHKIEREEGIKSIYECYLEKNHD